MSLTYIYQKDCLKGEYLKVFDKVELYANVHGISDDAKNDALLNLIDMLSVAQSKDKGTEKIVGNLDKKEAKVERVVKELIKECEEEGIDIFEYAKRFEEASEENEVIENGEIE